MITAIYLASSCGYVDIVQYLLENKADPNIPDAVSV